MPIGRAIGGLLAAGIVVGALKPLVRKKRKKRKRRRQRALFKIC